MTPARCRPSAPGRASVRHRADVRHRFAASGRAPPAFDGCRPFDAVPRQRSTVVPRQRSTAVPRPRSTWAPPRPRTRMARPRWRTAPASTGGGPAACVRRPDPRRTAGLRRADRQRQRTAFPDPDDPAEAAGSSSRPRPAPGRGGAPAAHLRVGGIRLVPSWQARSQPGRTGEQRGQQQHRRLDLSRGRGLARGGGGARAHVRAESRCRGCPSECRGRTLSLAP